MYSLCSSGSGWQEILHKNIMISRAFLSFRRRLYRIVEEE